MTHTLKDLKSGRLIGSKTFKLAAGLREFPDEIFSLADTLEILDLSDNQLSVLPDGMPQLKKLKIIFFARNNFVTFPSILATCPALSMIGFKSNQLTTIPEDAFPPKLRWLVLTDNKIAKLPKSIGDCSLLQKCALAGNTIEELPAEMANCVNLELLRISANQLQHIPQWLFEMPKLSWVALGGNPAAHRVVPNADFDSFSWHDFSVKELLGEGASGLISKAHWNSSNEEVAIKVFKGDVTSDGLPADEMEASITAGFHENLIQVLGRIKDHPQGKSGLIMKLISPAFFNLGGPPSFETCTRDVFDVRHSFSEDQLIKIAKSIASVSAQLHSKGINHGDLYAHNILVSESADCLLGDFGAATFYDVNAELAGNIERVEVRAFGCLLEDLLSLSSADEVDHQRHNRWQKLVDDCTVPDVHLRLSFNEISERLTKI